MSSLTPGAPELGFLHFEAEPKTLSRARASRIETYELPATRADFQPRRAGTGSDLARIARGGSGGDLVVDHDGSFTFSVPFAHGPGIYTVVAWLRTGNHLVAASNIAIRVKP